MSRAFLAREQPPSFAFARLDVVVSSNRRWHLTSMLGVVLVLQCDPADIVTVEQMLLFGRGPVWSLWAPQ